MNDCINNPSIISFLIQIIVNDRYHITPPNNIFSGLVLNYEPEDSFVSVKLFNALLDHGYHINTVDSNDMTLLDTASNANCNSRTISMLMYRGAIIFDTPSSFYI